MNYDIATAFYDSTHEVCSQSSENLIYYSYQLTMWLEATKKCSFEHEKLVDLMEERNCKSEPRCSSPYPQSHTMQSTTDPNHLTFLRDNMNSVKMRISELESQIEEKPDDLQLSREITDVGTQEQEIAENATEHKIKKKNGVLKVLHRFWRIIKRKSKCSN
ncbi:t-SNARE coiled-coil homology domain-containing protein [Caenorhabditis elegans]|uniref:t-SNARE coiled-coil homology domain-containing protein n=1 Tax=Caenorhabditis elegans TaxID=6239 RepID=O16895_CAEEL|nr:t-SNARE coiled-coil homology domain-containing protein [Caenorhabditis elegans]CCD69364.2 t-SNARE coiled-coil homology domain-containing protein [Caenorhabditis elegans]|eukprot:NP_504208.3 Uncharacterized protein CELE_F13A2.2 [Caenorhabditis elegans]